MRKLIVFSLLILPFLVTGQMVLVEDLVFSEIEHDFGFVDASKKLLTHRFEFTNQSKNAFYISNVDTECGCTSTDWPRDGVKPGEKGYIDIEFNTKGFYGEITKSIYIKGNFSNIIQKSLRIKVNIANKLIQNETDFYEKNVKLRLSSQVLNFGVAYHNQINTTSLEMTNISTYPLKIKNILRVPKGVEIIPEKDEILPGDTVKITAKLDGNIIKHYGTFSKSITLQVNDGIFPNYLIYVYAEMEDNFDHLKKREIRKGPKISFNKTLLDYGKVKSGGKYYQKITITNTGKKTLEIKDIYSSCRCEVVGTPPKTIEPGKSAVLKIAFDALWQKGRKYRNLIIYSNDPKNPKQKIVLRADVN